MSIGRKLSGNENRGIKQDRATRPALTKRTNTRRALEAARELDELIRRISL